MCILKPASPVIDTLKSDERAIIGMCAAEASSTVLSAFGDCWEYTKPGGGTLSHTNRHTLSTHQQTRGS